MTQYRIYSLDKSGHSNLAREIMCRDDLDALAEGELLSAQNDVEIWQAARLVARVKQGNVALNAADHCSL